MAANAPSHAMKKLINKVEDLVPESLAGLQAAHPDLVRIDAKNNVVLRAGGPKQGKVGIISGGGSGHEPMHGGFVGLGMLDAAVSGEVFTSPVPDQMEAAAGAVDSGAGVLFIVKNYTGDVLNFEMAAELAEDEGIRVAKVAGERRRRGDRTALYTAGRRGAGGTLFVEKIAGALRRGGRAAADVVAIVARQVNESAAARGLALTCCTSPAKGSPTFDLRRGELELGIGIHGEPGRRGAAAMMTSPGGSLAEFAVDAVLDDLRPRLPCWRWSTAWGRRRCWSCTASPTSVHRVLALAGYRGRPGHWSGNYVTSLDMAGASVTLCQVDEEMLGCGTRRWSRAGAALGRLSDRRRTGDRMSEDRRLRIRILRPGPDARRGLLPPLAHGGGRGDRPRGHGLTELDSPSATPTTAATCDRGFAARAMRRCEKAPPRTPARSSVDSCRPGRQD